MPIVEFLDKGFSGLKGFYRRRKKHWGEEKNYFTNVIHKIVFWLRACLTLFVPIENKQFDTWQLPFVLRSPPHFALKHDKKLLNAPVKNMKLVWTQTEKTEMRLKKCELGLRLFHTSKFTHFRSPKPRSSVFLVQEIKTKSRTTPSEHFINFSYKQSHLEQN